MMQEEDGKVYTAEQMGVMRHILINAARDKALEKAAKFASCGQSDSGGGIAWMVGTLDYISKLYWLEHSPIQQLKLECTAPHLHITGGIPVH